MGGFELEEVLETTFQMGFTVSKKLEGRKRLGNDFGPVSVHGSKDRKIWSSTIEKADWFNTEKSWVASDTRANVFIHI